jgi:hypothetical protein
MKDIIRLPAEHYLDLIRTNKPFQLARFGDGEVLCMKLKPHPLTCNCDGSKFADELVEPMRQIFRNNYNYYHCALDCTFNENGSEFKAFVEDNCPHIQFYDGEIWQHLSFDGRITEFIEVTNPYFPVIVGGSHLENIKHMKGFEKPLKHIETPKKDAYKKLPDIHNEIMACHAIGYRMFLFGCGYVSKILIDSLFPYIGHDTFLIDVGSVFDPYVGRLSRDGMKFKGYRFFQPYTNLILPKK